jgi:hypothetical protein
MKSPLDIGQLVKHEVFGLGKAIDSDGRRTTIDFQDHGVKTFVTSMLEVQPTDEQLRKKTRKAAVKATPKTEAS